MHYDNIMKLKKTDIHDKGVPGSYDVYKKKKKIDQQYRITACLYSLLIPLQFDN